MSTTPKRRLYRSTDDRVITGVCGGIADYFGIDATLVRVVMVVLTIASIGIPIPLIYLVLALVTPRDEGGSDRSLGNSTASDSVTESSDAKFSAEEIEAWGLQEAAASTPQSSSQEG